MMDIPLIVPHAEPFFFPGGKTGCLLLHGFTSMPEEMRWLGEYLAGEGHTVLGVRLAGHATHPKDLARAHWRDWLISVEDGLAVLRGTAERIFIIGLSMGGIIALLSAANYPIAGVVAMSTPAEPFSRRNRLYFQVLKWIRPMLYKFPLDKNNPLAERREPNYPAYPMFPPSIQIEVARLLDEMLAALPRVTVPTLLIQSRHDAWVSAENMPKIYERLSTPDKQMLWLDNFDHALVRDSKREVVFAEIGRFMQQ